MTASKVAGPEVLPECPIIGNLPPLCYICWAFLERTELDRGGGKGRRRLGWGMEGGRMEQEYIFYVWIRERDSR